MNVDTFLYRDLSTFAKVRAKSVDTFLYREVSTWIKIRFGSETAWYRNVLFTEPPYLILVEEKLYY